MTDPIVDVLTRLHNASSAYHESVSMPCSKVKVAVANVLQTEGYVKDYQIEGVRVGRTPVLNLGYGTKHGHTIPSMKHASKPDLRVYAKSDKLLKVMGGLGVVIIPSSSGPLIDREAADRGVGGEVIAYIW